MRKLKRMVAKYKMRKLGMTNFFDKRGGDSFFSKHWRNYI